MQVRLSIPFIGGPTVVYDQEEFQQLKTDTKNRLASAYRKTKHAAVATGLGALSGTVFTVAFVYNAYKTLESLSPQEPKTINGVGE